MARSTPTEKAIADVEKAIKEADKAAEKSEAAQTKADEAALAANRAEKTLRWTASHPDLPDDFDLDEFRRSLEEPFEETDLTEATEQADEAAKELAAETATPDVVVEQDDDISDDDPFAEDAA